MDWLQAFWLALIQGATEFLPISSSGHLVLVPKLLGWPDQGLEFDVAVHLGTLLAVVAYFRKELTLMTIDWFYSLRGRGQTAYSRLAWNLVIATVFVGIAGLVFQDFISSQLRNPLVIAISTIFFGLVLGLAEHFGKKNKSIESVKVKQAIFIGLAQAVALIPGTSRSGITLSAGLMLGLTKEAAARFSFLMAIPVITLAAGLYTVQLTAQSQPTAWSQLFFATALSGFVALLCIHFFLKYIQKFSLLPFVIYRLLLGGILFWIFI